MVDRAVVAIGVARTGQDGQVETVARHRTAMTRTMLSRPLQHAHADGLLDGDISVFDYGCGRGDDVRTLNTLGIRAAGWDPAHAPHAPIERADVVNLGYVVNVIENLDERREVLRSAWELATGTLVVSARLVWDPDANLGKAYRDGRLTTTGTFQKFYTPEELKGWIESVLRRTAVTAAPGVYYVFRDERAAQRLLAQHTRQSSRPRRGIAELLYEQGLPLLGPLEAYVRHHRTLPAPSDLTVSADIIDRFGSMRAAFSLVRKVTGPERWTDVEERARENFLVYAALAAFGGRPKFGDLPDELQYDAKDLYGSYSSACEEADRVLHRIANLDAINQACHAAKFGKLTSEALYVHIDYVSELPPLLRIYEGAARQITGDVDEATLVKLNRLKPQVSFLVYPEFETLAHPPIEASIVAKLGEIRVKYRQFGGSDNPPILHRKELFLPEQHPTREKFAKLTQQEERAGLLDRDDIGTLRGWQGVLAEAGYEIKGHQLRRSRA